MATVNVYVSDDLKARMTAHDLKWSQIAAAAIETAINLEERKAVNMETAALERLRVSRTSAAEHRYADGVKAGKDWALNRAEFPDIERVARLSDDQVPWNHAVGADACARELAAAILDDDQPTWEEVATGMERLFGRAAPSTHEVEGFVAGVCEVLDAV